MNIYMISKSAGENDTHKYSGEIGERVWFDIVGPALWAVGKTMDDLVETTSATGWASHCFTTDSEIAQDLPGIDIEKINADSELYNDVIGYFEVFTPETGEKREIMKKSKLSDWYETYYRTKREAQESLEGEENEENRAKGDTENQEQRQ